MTTASDLIRHMESAFAYIGLQNSLTLTGLTVDDVAKATCKSVVAQIGRTTDLNHDSAAKLLKLVDASGLIDELKLMLVTAINDRTLVVATSSSRASNEVQHCDTVQNYFPQSIIDFISLNEHSAESKMDCATRFLIERLYLTNPAERTQRALYALVASLHWPTAAVPATVRRSLILTMKRCFEHVRCPTGVLRERV